MAGRKKVISKRKEKGWSQEVAAKKFGVSQQFISFIEQGKRKPPLVLAKEMERIYGAPMEELFPDIFLKSNTTECDNGSQEPA